MAKTTGELQAEFDHVHLVPTEAGARLMAVVSGGSLTLGDLEATILPGGGDTVTLGADQVGRMNIRLVARAGDSTAYLVAIGRSVMTDAGRDRFLGGHVVTETDIRGRIALTFDGTTDSPWGPLTSALAIGGVREFSTARITYDIELVP